MRRGNTIPHRSHTAVNDRLTGKLFLFGFTAITMPAKTIGLKLSDELRAQVVDKCKSKSCRTSDYLKELIVRDISGAEQANPEALKVSTVDIEAVVERVMQKRQRAQPEVKTIYPSFFPYVRCKQGDCDKLHTNPDYKQPPVGKCDSCDQFNGRTNGPCPWCKYGQLRPLTELELESLELRLTSVSLH